MATAFELIEVAGREVKVTNPDKVYWEGPGYTKLDLVRYYLAVADGALRGAGGRPMALKRFVNGAGGDFFFQKRAPDSRPDWIETVVLSFPSGRTAEEVVLRDAASLAWVANLGCLDLNPHPVRADDLDHPDELRVDLDPVPGVPWSQVREVALVAREALESVGLVGWPKTSGSRGIHVNVRIEPRWTFDEVRRAALALARDVERRAPALATSKWWKEERHGVFLDYNQNAKDRTVASAYSVRPTPGRARLHAAGLGRGARRGRGRLHAGDGAARSSPERGDPGPGIDATAGSLDALLELAARHEAEGLGDAPVAAALPQAGGRAAPRAALEAARIRPAPPQPAARDAVTDGPPTQHQAAHRDRRGRHARRMRWPAWSAGRRVTRRRRRTSSRRTSSSTPCAAAPRPGRASASTSSTCPEAAAPPAGAARSRLRPRGRRGRRAAATPGLEASAEPGRATETIPTGDESPGIRGRIWRGWRSIS